MSAVTDDPPRVFGASEAPVSAQARGLTRLAKATVDTRDSALQGAADRVPKQLLRDVRHRTSAGRDKAMAAILKAMQTQPLHTEKRAALWRTIVTDGDLFRVEALSFGTFGTGGWTRREFGLEATFHSIGRLLDRSGFSVDPIAAMREAHDNLLALRPDEGHAVFALGNVVLPAGPGAFLVTTRAASGSEFPFAQCRTWVSDDQLYQDQGADVAAWDNLLSIEPQTTARKRG